MTPAQAAVILQVSESDVVAAIEAGDLKAGKRLDPYRISKAAQTVWRVKRHAVLLKSQDPAGPTWPRRVFLLSDARFIGTAMIPKRLFLLFTWLTGFLVVVILIGRAGAAANDNTPTYLSLLGRDSTFPPSTAVPAYGITFINSAEGRADAQQLANAQITGAQWDRAVLESYRTNPRPIQLGLPG